MRSLLLLFTCALLFTSACSDELAVQDQPCPCAEGFHCDLSGGEPGVCREGPALLATLIDRFDDDSFDDWEHFDGEVELVDGRLLAYRTATTGHGAVRRPIDIPVGPFVFEADVALYTDSSRASIWLHKNGGDRALTIHISNNAQDENLTGFYLVDGFAYAVSPDQNSVISQPGTPNKDQTYRLRLVYDGSGTLEYFADGTSIGKATVEPLPALDRIELHAGQNSFENHGAYFDNIVVHSLPGPVPTFVPDEDNPLREAAGLATDVLWDVDEYKALIIDGQTSFHLESSPDGKVWTELARDVLDTTTTGRRFLQQAVMLPTEGGYRAWLNGTDGQCHEYASIFSASSTDAMSWSGGELVIDYGAPGAFDSRGYSALHVVHDGERFHLFAAVMWAKGGDQCSPGDHRGHSGIAHASSVDGVTWEKHGVALPVGMPGELDDRTLAYPRVLRSESGWQMVYNGQDERGGSGLMFATSEDGFAWIKHGPIDGSSPVAVGFHLHNGNREIFYGCGGLLCRGTLQD